MSGLTNYKTSTYLAGTTKDLSDIFASLTVSNTFTGSTTTFNDIQSSSAIYCDTYYPYHNNTTMTIGGGGLTSTNSLAIGNNVCPTTIYGSTVTAPTPTTKNNSTQVATTAFVQDLVQKNSSSYPIGSIITGAYGNPYSISPFKSGISNINVVTIPANPSSYPMIWTINYSFQIRTSGSSYNISNYLSYLQLGTSVYGGISNAIANSGAINVIGVQAVFGGITVENTTTTPSFGGGNLGYGSQTYNIVVNAGYNLTQTIYQLGICNINGYGYDVNVPNTTGSLYITVLRIA